MQHNHPTAAPRSTEKRAALADMIAIHRASLDLADALCDRSTNRAHADVVRRNITKYRARIAWYENLVATSWEPEAAASHALGMLGRNGCGPAIDHVLVSARYVAADRAVAL